MTLAEFEPLAEAEKAVIAGLGTGHVTVLGNGTLPEADAGEDRQVRASLIRWLALGAPGDDKVHLHEKGLRIKGALVVSDGQVDPAIESATSGLDLEGCTLSHDLILAYCRFQDNPLLQGARVQSLNLHGAALPGLNADRLEVRGNVFLLGVRATGEVRLPGAQVEGDLVCEGGRFENAGGVALSADSARVTGTLFWRKGSHSTGAIDLSNAEIGGISDDPACWPGPDDLLLNRCRYGALTGTGVSGAERIRWLDLQTPARWGDVFWPQPWEQCAKVLREMGHSKAARQVLIAKEERQRRGTRERAAARLSAIRRRIARVDRKAPAHDIDARLAARSGLVEAWWQLAVLRLRDGALGALIAYGYRPLRAVWWLVAFWIFGAVLFGVAHGDGGFKPNNAFILSKPEWAQCAARSETLGDPSLTLSCWQEKDAAKGYPAFNPLLYSLDTLVPVVDLEVQAYWVPDERAAPWARWYLWGHIGMGWFLALLAVAGFSGLVQSRATEE